MFYLLRGEEAEKEVNRWQEESFPMAEMWVKPYRFSVMSVEDKVIKQVMIKKLAPEEKK